MSELSSRRLAVGEAYNVGRLYAGLTADWQILGVALPPRTPPTQPGVNR